MHVFSACAHALCVCPMERWRESVLSSDLWIPGIQLVFLNLAPGAFTYGAISSGILGGSSFKPKVPGLLMLGQEGGAWMGILLRRFVAETGF